MRNISHRSCRENQNIHFLLNNFFFENGAILEKYCTAGHATDDNMAQAHCMLDI
jgi:hypothetical protein